MFENSTHENFCTKTTNKKLVEKWRKDSNIIGNVSVPQSLIRAAFCECASEFVWKHVTRWQHFILRCAGIYFHFYFFPSFFLDFDPVHRIYVCLCMQICLLERRWSRDFLIPSYFLSFDTFLCEFATFRIFFFIVVTLPVIVQLLFI